MKSMGESYTIVSTYREKSSNIYKWSASGFTMDYNGFSESHAMIRMDPEFCNESAKNSCKICKSRI